MDETGAYYTQWSKPKRKKVISIDAEKDLHKISHVFMINKLKKKQEEETRIERDMYPNVHHSTIYNSQDMEAT